MIQASECTKANSSVAAGSLQDAGELDLRSSPWPDSYRRQGRGGCVTHKEREIVFNVCVECSLEQLNLKLAVAIWHNGTPDAQWAELPLVYVCAPPLMLGEATSVANHHLFRGGIVKTSDFASSFEFTVKYKLGSGLWHWVNDSQPSPNGKVCLQSAGLPTCLRDCFSRLNGELQVDSLPSEAVGTRLWQVSFETAAADQKPKRTHRLLGVPLRVIRWFALIRQSAAWVAPRHGKGVFKVDKDAFICSFLRLDGTHLVMMGLSGLDSGPEGADLLMRDDDFGAVTLTARSNACRPSKATLLVAAGFTHETALAACMYQARKLRRGLRSSQGSDQSNYRLRHDVSHLAWYEKWQNRLSYCTWNSLGVKISHAKILDALDSLKKAKIAVATLIIDDGWQSREPIDALPQKQGWSRFEADHEQFPFGLADCVRQIHEEHPHIKHVAVWHAILGYWGGVSRTSEIAQRYQTCKIHTQASEPFSATEMAIVDPVDVGAMYQDFYRFLFDAGVDGVKTDAQCFLDLLKYAQDARSVPDAYESAWKTAYLEHFSNCVISCMSMAPRLMLRHLPSDSALPIEFRNSDDYFPHEPDSHTWHVFCNSFNALFTQHLNVLPDWDMFQTRHEWASFHAAARCLSGGPICITDPPGEHDFQLIQQVTGRMPDGTTCILRPDRPGRAIPSSVYTAYEDRRFLKMGSFHGDSRHGVGLLGIFNVRNTRRSELIHLHEVPGLSPTRRYVFRRFRTQGVALARPNAKTTPIALTLEHRGWEILAASPVLEISQPARQQVHASAASDIAVLGLIDKMTGSTAVQSVEIYLERPSNLKLTIVLKALGKLGIYHTGLAGKDIKDTVLVLVHEQLVPADFVSMTQERVLQVDLEAAWDALDIGPDFGSVQLLLPF